MATAPPLSSHELIADCLLSKLSAIAAGADFNYTPSGGAVVRTTFFSVDFLEHGFDMIYLLRSQDESVREGVSGVMQSVAEFFVLGAKAWPTRGTEPFNIDPPFRAEVQDRVAADIRRAVMTDVALRSCALGLAYVNAKVTDIDRSIAIEGWAVVQARIEVEYDSSIFAP